MPPTIMHQAHLENILIKMCEAAGVKGEEAEAAKDMVIKALKQEFDVAEDQELGIDHVQQVLNRQSDFVKGKGLSALLDMAIQDKTLSPEALLEFMKSFAKFLRNTPEEQAKKTAEKELDKELDDLMKKLKLDPHLKEAFLAEMLLNLEKQKTKDPLNPKIALGIRLVMNAKKAVKKDEDQLDERETQVRNVSGGVGTKEGEYSVVMNEQLNPMGWPGLSAATDFFLHKTVLGEDEAQNVELAALLKTATPSGGDDLLDAMQDAFISTLNRPQPRH